MTNFLIKHASFALRALLALIAATTLSSCVKEDYSAVSPSAPPKGKVRLSMLVNVPDRQVRLARAGDADIDPDGLYLLIFSTTGGTVPNILMECVKASYEGTDPAGAVKFSAIVSETTQQQMIYIAANVSREITAMGLVPGITFGDVVGGLTSEPLPVDAQDRITAMPQSHSMISDRQQFPDGLSGNISLGTIADPVKLHRNTVKITATDLTGSDDFQLININAAYAPESAAIFEDPMGKLLPRHNYAESLAAGLAGPDGRETLPIYTFEAPLQKDVQTAVNTYFIVKAAYKGVEGYYRIDVLDKGSLNDAPLIRNFHYRINIKRVERSGYPTAQEAMNNKPSNAMVYDISINDLYSNDIISNGEQFLGVSNSEYIILSDRGVDAVRTLAVTISYTSKPEWSTGVITYSGGIIPHSGTTLAASSTANERKDKDIIVTVPSNFSSGKITFRIGDLYKEITVSRADISRNMLSSYDGGALAIEDPNVISAEVENPMETTWLRVGTTTDRSISGMKTYLNPGDKLYLHVWGNEEHLSTTITEPLGYAYASRNNNAGRIKYCVVKEVTAIHFDPNGGYGQPERLLAWEKQGTSDDVVMMLPTLTPLQHDFLFEGWSMQRNGSGTLYAAGEAIYVPFGKTTTLYAAWKEVSRVVFANGKYWAEGNLVSDGNGGLKIGNSSDHGLLFRFGSLVGYAGNNINTPAVYSDPSQSAVAFKDSPYTASGNVAADAANAAAGTGDPCRYYLGSTWRLPTNTDFTNLKSAGMAYSTSQGWQFQGILRLPVAGIIDYNSGSYTYLLGMSGGGKTIYWTSVGSSSYAYNLYADQSGTFTGIGNYDERTIGATVRCVSDTAP